MTKTPKIPAEYMITRQGKDFALYAGLLAAAHNEGLKRISTTLIQIPHADNGNVAIVSAEVETDKGQYSGIGDASPKNVTRMIVEHSIRMAETRAKARALRDAVNVSEACAEELSDDPPNSPEQFKSENAEPEKPKSTASSSKFNKPAAIAEAKAAVFKLANGDPAKIPDIASKLRHTLGLGDEPPIDELEPEQIQAILHELRTNGDKLTA